MNVQKFYEIAKSQTEKVAKFKEHFKYDRPFSPIEHLACLITNSVNERANSKYRVSFGQSFRQTLWTVNVQNLEDLIFLCNFTKYMMGVHCLLVSKNTPLLIGHGVLLKDYVKATGFESLPFTDDTDDITAWDRETNPCLTREQTEAVLQEFEVSSNLTITGSYTEIKKVFDQLNLDINKVMNEMRTKHFTYVLKMYREVDKQTPEVREVFREVVRRHLCLKDNARFTEGMKHY